MSIEISEKVSKYVEELDSGSPVDITWHGGEPLATGINRFEKMLRPFESLRESGRIRHYIQTNATLIDERWCQLFLDYNFAVGVSIDGPKWANHARVDWAGRDSYEQTISGINFLKNSGIPFSAIAVVNNSTLGYVTDLFEFFYSLGCFHWGVNIEEMEGMNDSSVPLPPSDVKDFWAELFSLWREKPEIEIREISRYIDFARYCISTTNDDWIEQFEVDIFPTIGWNGDVYLLSPELAGMTSTKYLDFVVGNILRDEVGFVLKLADSVDYVKEFREGVMLCKEQCSYFAFCGGGQASNKFFEHGSFATTQTDYCLNSIQLVFDGITSVLERK